MFDNIKTCPFCAEKIKSAAIVCKHCGRELAIQNSLEEYLGSKLWKRYMEREEFYRKQYKGLINARKADRILQSLFAPSFRKKPKWTQEEEDKFIKEWMEKDATVKIIMIDARLERGSYQRWLSENKKPP